MKTFLWIYASTLIFGPGAMAAPAPVTGGGLQFRPPAAIPAAPAKLDIQQSSPPAALGSEPGFLKIVVKSLKVTGAQAFAEADLIATTGFRPGNALTLGELQDMAQVIASHYRQNGYPVAQAYLPAQDINDGAVTIAVTEGHYGKVLVRNQTNIAGEVITDLMEGIAVGEVEQQFVATQSGEEAEPVSAE
ncbi:MAG: POTRA domain-containing protein [Burkholderiaceae bacterium]|nr:POTRA domain-containing protein [Burkholderiaceae bacterium]